MIGQTLSHYSILEKLGSGGMGVVYAAKDAKLGRVVALKFLPEAVAKDPAAVERFQREARAASALNHPNICTIYEIDEIEGCHFIAMELLEGQPLANQIAGRALETEQVAKLGMQIADALEAAHAKGIVHRDIKPGNIFVTESDQVKVLDFGLAKVPLNQLTTEDLTDTQSGAGTLPYMAPEQLRGLKIDARTDIYAVGTVLYEMATGTRPFRSQLSAPLTDDILHKAPLPPGRVNPEVPPRLDDIILKCLEKDPAHRYQSAKELGVDLRRLIAPATEYGIAMARPRQRWRRTFAITLTALLTVTAILAVVFGTRRPPVTNAPAQRKIQSLAVLPFENLSHDKEQEYFSDGIAEALITDLSQISTLRVISRTSAMRYKDTKKTLPEIARELSVDAVLEGSVQRSGKQVRVTAQLIHAATDAHLWAASYDRDVQDVLQLESSVARAIADQIQVTLTPQEKAHLAATRQVNADAYEAYLRGRYEWNKRTADGLRRAVEFFQDALSKDPGYALAYAGLADSYFSLAYSAEVLRPREAVPKAKTAALKALELDSSLAEAHATLGAIEFFYDWDKGGAEQEFKHAIALNAGYATAHHWYGLLLGWTGRVPEAKTELRRAQQLDPLASIIGVNLAWTSYLARDFDKAAEQLGKTLEADPDFWVAYWDLGQCKLALGRYRDAIADLQKAVELSGGNTGTLAMLGYAYGVVGERALAMQVLQRLKKLSQTRYVSPSDLALVEFGLGNKDQGFAWLEKAYQDRPLSLVALQTEALYDPWRSDARFVSLLRRMRAWD